MEEIKFEKAIEKLEKIVEFLESGEIPLDEALKRYEEGIKIARLCGQKLAEAEQKIEMLVRDPSGNLRAVSFDEDAAEKAEKKSKRTKKGSVRDDEDKGDNEFSLES